MSEKNKTLFYLDDLSKYKVDSDDSDVRGWEVKDADNRVVGKVDRLLANKETERVVYLDIEVDQSLIEDGHDTYEKSAGDGVHEFMNEDGENHLIIPIGLVRLDQENETVFSDEIDYNTFAKTKRINKNTNVDREYEVAVLEHYLPARKEDQVKPTEDEFYDRKEFEHSRYEK